MGRRSPAARSALLAAALSAFAGSLAVFGFDLTPELLVRDPARLLDLAAGLVEQIIAAGFQCCLLDPEGDYSHLEGVVVIGDAKCPPRIPNIIALLMDPHQSVVINLLGVDLAERPRFLSGLMPAIAEYHSEKARPHWLVIDELNRSNFDRAFGRFESQAKLVL